MAACSTWKYGKITPKVFEALRSMAKKEGYRIPSSHSGRFTIKAAGMGASFQYAWSE